MTSPRDGAFRAQGRFRSSSRSQRPFRHHTAELCPPGSPHDNTHHESPALHGVPPLGSGVQCPSLVRVMVATGDGLDAAAETDAGAAAGAELDDVLLPSHADRTTINANDPSRITTSVRHPSENPTEPDVARFDVRH